MKQTKECEQQENHSDLSSTDQALIHIAVVSADVRTN